MIYVTGDCHGNFRRFQSDCFPEQANMTKRWPGWNACPSRWYSSAATMKTMTRWNDALLRSGTAVRYTVFVPMFCT